MALQIKATPTLKGKAAIDFERKAQNNINRLVTTEEKKDIKRAYSIYLNVMKNNSKS